MFTICTTCGQLFIVRTFFPLKKKFCSINCLWASKPKLWMHCEYCRREFLIKPSQLIYGRQFCGRRCRFRAFPCPEKRFWKFVNKTPTCWLWTGARDKKYGFGFFNAGPPAGNITTASRFAWELIRGPLEDNLKVCRTCDEPSCCRPEHMMIRTQSELMRAVTKKWYLLSDPQQLTML